MGALPVWMVGLSMPPTDQFSLAAYRALLEALLEAGYCVRDFSTVMPERADVILRHDIDVSLPAALPVAALEAELGLGASYFVLVRSTLYNPFAPQEQTALQNLCDLGHQIGLHFDASLYGDDRATLDSAAERECAILETITGAPVEMISFHRPARTFLNDARPIAGRAHAYQPRYFSEIGYCSDSNGEWGHGHPLDHAAFAARSALQLLTHPIWWSGIPSEDVQARLERHVDARAREIRQALQSGIKKFTVNEPE